jgi:hypothetical protein
MTPDDVLCALSDLRDERIRLSRDQWQQFIDAVEEVVRVMLVAPRSDTTQLTIWHTHERLPALAGLADAARPGQPSLADELWARQLDEIRVVRELYADVSGRARQSGRALGQG